MEIINEWHPIQTKNLEILLGFARSLGGASSAAGQCTDIQVRKSILGWDGTPLEQKHACMVLIYQNQLEKSAWTQEGEQVY